MAVFFGTISTVEDEIRKLLEVAKWQASPIRFLIIDLGMVHGLDFSSAEAFVRVQRLLAAKDVLLILCGAAPNGLVGTALRGVDLWADREGTHVEVFAGLNDALEWTENAYLYVLLMRGVPTLIDGTVPRSMITRTRKKPRRQRPLTFPRYRSHPFHSPNRLRTAPGEVISPRQATTIFHAVR